MFAGKRASAALFALLLVAVPLGCVPISQPAKAVYNYGGEEQMLVDPVRHLVYWTDLFGSDLLIYDSDTGLLKNTIPIGYQLSSLSLSPDNAILYICVLRDQQIVAFDPDAMSVTKRYNVNFIPFSIRASTADRLYVTGAESDAGYVKVLDLKAGNIRTNIQVGTNDMLLELSPDGNTLIVAAVAGYTDICEMWKFSTSGWTLTQVDKDNGDLTGGVEQMEVDWSNGLIYHASKMDTYVEVISLSTLDLLGHFDSTPGSNGISGLCLSKDGKMAYVSTYYWSYLCAFNTTTMEMVASEWLDYTEVGILATSYDDKVLFAEQPFTRFSLDPTISPVFPTPGSVFSFTPPWVNASIRMLGFRGLPILDIASDIDGETLTCSLVGNLLAADITHALADGNHTVNFTFVLADGNSSCNWTFRIDRTDTSTHPPTVTSWFPVEYYYVNWSPEIIVASLTASYPEVPFTNVSLYLDGVWLPGYLTYTYSWLIQYTSNVTFQLATGTHLVRVEVSWGPESLNYSWNFTYLRDAFVYPSYPTPGSTLTVSPQSVKARADLGDPPVTLDSVTMRINDVEYTPVVVSAGNTSVEIRLDLATNLTDGDYYVWVEIAWEGRTANASWFFVFKTPTTPIVPPYDEVVGPITLVMHESPLGFRVPVPTIWDTQDDVDVGGEHVDVLVNGPVVGSIQTNYLVMTGTDDTIEETDDYLSEMANQTIEDLKTEDPYITYINYVEYMTIDNHSAAVFSIRWSTYNMSQEIAIILSEASHRYWLLVFTVSSYYFGNYSSLFDAIIAGFDITLDERARPDGTNDILAGLAGLGIAAVLGGIAGILVWASRRKRKTTASQMMGPAMSLQEQRPVSINTACARCGSRIVAGQSFCPNCGATASMPGSAIQDRSAPGQQWRH